MKYARIAATSLLLFYSANSAIADEIRKVKLLIDPGHNTKTIGATGKAGIENILTLEVSKYLSDLLREDNSFDVESTRVDGYYTEHLINFRDRDKPTLLEIVNRPLLFKLRARINQDNKKDLYSIVRYAESAAKDALISLHFDSHHTDNGYHIIISPENKAYEQSKTLALNIAHQLSLKYNPSKAIDNGVGVEVSKQEKNELISRGVALRRTILLGDERYNSSIPTVLIELGNINDGKLRDKSLLEDIAESVYHGIRRTFYTGLSNGDIKRGNTNLKTVALTFDAENFKDNGKNILRILKEHNIKATFFLTGNFITRQQQTVKELVASGHEVANHTYSHSYLTTKDTARETLSNVNEWYIRYQLEITEKEFYKVTSKRMQNFWRAPYGRHNNQIRQWAKLAGYSHIGWTIDTRDWVTENEVDFNKPSNKEMLETILGYDKKQNGLNGAIILMHLETSRKHEKFHEVLPELISKLKAMGYSFAPVSEIIN